MTKFIKTKWLLLLVGAAMIGLATDGNRFLKISQSMENFVETYRIVNNQYVEETDPNQLMRVAIDSMLAHVDPYTNYFSEAQMVKVKMGVKGGWDGIGIELMQLDSQTIVREVIQDSPAEENDLRVGDVLLEVEGTEITNQKIEAIAQTLQGKAGTKVAIKIQRPATQKVRTLKVERAKVVKENVPYYGMLDEETGYIVLTKFTQRAGANVENALKSLQEKHNPKQLILDLRDNGGGFLIEAVNICNIFLNKGHEIVYTRNKIKKWDRSFQTLNNPLDTKIPLIVLMNGSSASASEIVAGALQDLDRAVLVGRNSFGKGLVQNTKDIGYSSKVKVTTAKYYIPSGRCVQALDYKDGRPVRIADSLRKEFTTKSGRKVYDGRGLEPDLEVKRERASAVVSALKYQQLFFKFANRYREQNDSINDAKTFKITDKEYQSFVDFCYEEWMDYQTGAQEKLQALKVSAKKEGNWKALKEKINRIENKIEEEKKKAFQTHKATIKSLVEQEIVDRYYYMQGRVQNRLAQDTDVLEALALFKDKDKFNQLLQP